MKRATLNHPKTRALAAALSITRRDTLGLLTLLWDFAGQYAPTGTIGRFTNRVIADAVDWTGDGDELIGHLIQTGWLDETSDQSARLVVHDWSDHCEQWVRKRLTREGLEFYDAESTVARTDVPSGHRRNPQRPDEMVGLPSLAQPSPAKPSLPKRKIAATRNDRGPSRTVKIEWSPEVGWSRISDADRERWKKAYPACDIDRQLAAMREWLLGNPTRAHKKLWRRFITNWMSRAQERGGDDRNGPPKIPLAERMENLEVDRD